MCTRRNGSRLGGVHLEMTGEDVTECTGGARGLSDADLARAYRTQVDPRLNYEQALELAHDDRRAQQEGARPLSFDGREFASTLPRRPGVYRMYGGPTADAAGRCCTWARPPACAIAWAATSSQARQAPKVEALVRQIRAVEVTVTDSETEALLLEYNLIKEHRPRFNVILRDDKSFPYIQLQAARVSAPGGVSRAAQSRAAATSARIPMRGAVRATLQQLQKLFRLRNCRDSFFAQSHASLPAAPDRPLLGALRGPDRARRTMRATWMRP